MAIVDFQMRRTSQYRWAQSRINHIEPLVQFLAKERHFRRLMALVLEDLRRKNDCNVAIPPSHLQFVDPNSYRKFKQLLSDALSAVGPTNNDLGRFRGYVFQATVERLLQSAYPPPVWCGCSEAMILVRGQRVVYHTESGRTMVTVDWAGLDRRRRIAVLAECKVFPDRFTSEIRYFIEIHLPLVLEPCGWTARPERYALGTSAEVAQYLMDGINVLLF